MNGTLCIWHVSTLRIVLRIYTQIEFIYAHDEHHIMILGFWTEHKYSHDAMKWCDNILTNQSCQYLKKYENNTILTKNKVPYNNEIKKNPSLIVS